MVVLRRQGVEYRDGALYPEQPLPLRRGERVDLILLRQSDALRWDLDRLARAAGLDERGLTEQGLDAWCDALETEDQR
jgi:predicted DNA-binding antitoxin AbrB/MazE fold protein